MSISVCIFRTQECFPYWVDEHKFCLEEAWVGGGGGERMRHERRISREHPRQKRSRVPGHHCHRAWVAF